MLFRVGENRIVNIAQLSRALALSLLSTSVTCSQQLRNISAVIRLQQ